VVHNTALNSSDNLHSYPPDSHHSSEKNMTLIGGEWVGYHERRW